MAKLLLPFLVIALIIHNINGLHECCPKPNVLFQSSHSCLSSESIRGANLTCPDMTMGIVIQDLRQFSLKLLKNGTLLNSEDSQLQYCHTTQEGSSSTNKTYIVCWELENPQFDNIRDNIEAVLIGVSIVFVICTIVVYAMSPTLWGLQTVCIVHTLAGLAVGYTFLLTLKTSSHNLNQRECEAIPFLAYLGFCYLFFWLVALSFHIWRTTVQPRVFNLAVNWAMYYHVFAIGGTALALIILLLSHYSPSEVWENFRPGFGESKCWFKSDREIWIFFYGPILTMLIINIIFYLSTVTYLWEQAEHTRIKIMKYRFKMCLRLSIIMGMSWIVEIFTFVLNDHISNKVGKIFLLFVPDLINMLQGVLIFLVLVVYRKRVRRALASKRICHIKFPSSWRYLEDEEMESQEEKANGTVIAFKNVPESSTLIQS